MQRLTEFYKLGGVYGGRNFFAADFRRQKFGVSGYLAAARKSTRVGIFRSLFSLSLSDFAPAGPTDRNSLISCVLLDFYRAMLCIARTMLSHDVCLSVRPSITRRYSVDSKRLFHRRYSHSRTNSMTIFRRCPRLTGHRMHVGYEKSPFSTNISL